MKLVRDSATVLSKLLVTEDGPVIAKENIIVEVPSRFYTRGLGAIEDSYYTIGYIPFILESGEYSVCKACCFLELTPSSITDIDRGGVEYKRLFFPKGTTIIKTTRVVKTATLTFYILDEFILKGNVPWYLDYDDLCKIYDSVGKYADSSVGKDQEIIELIASLVTRAKSDKSKYARELAKSDSDLASDKIEYIAMTNVLYAPSSTVQRIAGNYVDDGITSSLVNETKKSSKIERILRA